MPVGDKYRIKIVKSTKVIKTESRSRPLAMVSVESSTEDILRAFKKARGYKDIK